MPADRLAGFMDGAGHRPTRADRRLRRPPAGREHRARVRHRRAVGGVQLLPRRLAQPDRDQHRRGDDSRLRGRARGARGLSRAPHGAGDEGADPGAGSGPARAIDSPDRDASGADLRRDRGPGAGNHARRRRGTADGAARRPARRRVRPRALEAGQESPRSPGTRSWGKTPLSCCTRTAPRSTRHAAISCAGACPRNGGPLNRSRSSPIRPGARTCSTYADGYRVCRDFVDGDPSGSSGS